ncbi:uncharacterized protein F4812DRAFT_460880 [Daldinia caldariorum]|uniref:uncharacterized protein n=1 Tax=Daldinia caldariorum TaxID=326644 RepID=UPI0020076496|nr:uncharacterized protein F4812DRAFT_460880 [Daldinia caldariorum]KAI1466610.1 hypothetical protein F4812DRAFT_460880 [Daldinia caldariorum]
MDSFYQPHSNDTSNISELMGSSFVDTIPARVIYKHQEEYKDERSPTLFEEPLSPRNINKPCFLQKGVIDKCYKGRFYSRAVEFHLLENDPTSFRDCRCLMENCPQRNFSDARDMLRHLKGCKYFSQGIFRCPTCNDAEKFQTTSSKKCSWDRPKMRQRLQNTIRATVDTVKDIVSPRSSAMTPFGHCKECGQTVEYKHYPSPFPGIHDRPCSISPIYDPAAIQMPQEMNDTVRGARVEELMDTSILLELQEKSPASDRGDANYGEVYNFPHVVSNCSPSLDLPIELPSVNIARTATIDTSSTVPTESPKSAFSSQPGHHCPSEDDQYMDFLGGVTSQEAIPNSNHLDLAYSTWQPSSSAQLYDIPSSHISIPPMSQGQRGFRESRGHSLTIQMNHLNSPLHVPIWENTTRHMNVLNLSAVGNIPSPMSSTDMPSHSNLDACVHSFTATKRIDPLQPTILVDLLSSPDSTIPSSNREQSPSSATSMLSNEIQQCPHCNYRPKGKKENAKAYLSKHISSTHGSTTYKCGFCEKAYSRRDNRGVHIRKHHSSEEGSKKRRKGADSPSSENHRSKRVLYDESGQTWI